MHMVGQKGQRIASALTFFRAIPQRWQGVLMMEMQLGTTITSKVYCKTLKKLLMAIQDKR
jgi:hypothetical protein